MDFYRQMNLITACQRQAEFAVYGMFELYFENDMPNNTVVPERCPSLVTSRHSGTA